ncbi:hypothetical protein JCM11251_007763 [Rhodosporidiobolus azoricus]
MCLTNSGRSPLFVRLSSATPWCLVDWVKDVTAVVKMVPEDAREAEVQGWVEAECGRPEEGAVKTIRLIWAVEGYRLWAVELWNANNVTKVVSSGLCIFRNDFVMVERSYLQEEQEERWSRKQAYLLCIQKTAGTARTNVHNPAAAEKTAAAMTLSAPCLLTQSTPSRPYPLSTGTAASPSPSCHPPLPLASISALGLHHLLPPPPPPGQTTTTLPAT